MLITPDVTQVPLVIPKAAPKEMLSISQCGGKTKVRVNYSSLSIMQTCARKSYYFFEREFRSEHDSAATCFGGAIHKALEVFYTAPRSERNIPPKFNEYSDLMAFGTPAPSEHFLYRAVEAFAKAASPLSALPDSDKRSISTGIWLLQNYFRTYIDDPFEVLVDEHGPIVERTCSRIIHEDDSLIIELFGTIDVILKNVLTNVVLPCDHKTSSIVGNDFYNRLKPNHQYTGYFWLAKECLGIEGDGFLVNCLQVKARPLTARGSPPNFPRQVTSRSDHDVEEFKDALIDAVNTHLARKKSGKWPLSDVNSCSFYGGCTYLEVCSSPHEVREAILRNKYGKEA